MMSWDESRTVDLKLKLLADDEWKLHKLNMKYYKNECTDEHNNPRYVVTMVTLVTNSVTMVTIPGM